MNVRSSDDGILEVCVNRRCREEAKPLYSLQFVIGAFDIGLSLTILYQHDVHDPEVARGHLSRIEPRKGSRSCPQLCSKVAVAQWAEATDSCRRVIVLPEDTGVELGGRGCGGMDGAARCEEGSGWCTGVGHKVVRDLGYEFWR